MATKKERERAEAINELREILRPGDTVYTILRHVSKSGMSRDISILIVRNGEHQHLNFVAAKAMGDRLVRSNGYDAIRCGGCGMDMGFNLVYNLGRALFPDGYVPADTGARARNGRPDTEKDTDGGYALRHQWL